MKRWLRDWGPVLFGAAAVFVTTWLVALAFASTQVLSRGDLYSNATQQSGTLWTCTSTCPSWSGSKQMATVGDFTGNFNSSGCLGTSSELIWYSNATGCAVLTSGHTFSLGSGSTTSATVCTGSSKGTATWSVDHWAFDATTSCYNSNTTIVTISGTWNISGTPTAQKYSFSTGVFSIVTSGDATNCTQVSGTVGPLTATVNGNTFTINSAPAENTTYSGSLPSAYLTNGNNAVAFNLTIGSARGTVVVRGSCVLTAATDQTMPSSGEPNFSATY